MHAVPLGIVQLRGMMAHTTGSNSTGVQLCWRCAVHVPLVAACSSLAGFLVLLSSKTWPGMKRDGRGRQGSVRVRGGDEGLNQEAVSCALFFLSASLCC